MKHIIVIQNQLSDSFVSALLLQVKFPNYKVNQFTRFQDALKFYLDCMLHKPVQEIAFILSDYELDTNNGLDLFVLMKKYALVNNWESPFPELFIVGSNWFVARNRSETLPYSTIQVKKFMSAPFSILHANAIYADVFDKLEMDTDNRLLYQKS